ncbi:DNA primase small subunit PriS [Saccharolobus islandicus]|uniref:DNA primase small subunit PriS n=3 Tax=Saccharolobus islandicus TaxID=43080 RepID=M9UDA5_SACIS|nr:DNA primase small subunit PriS [Sulfolobus islandicus]ADX82482.1 DNA primase small subunit, PriSL [Sulfolobus islandicus HVE10/4]ADX85114.1 DNA primase small subunit, PriSL [Sulfolobus islandicus REY15A]AGJ62506.1 Eukaryotic-type DNA primase, catalytic (small) subunit [Sulfolobus islandicus LAL14/1]WCM36231.1 DNA primase small subunit PriS [Sulfolobus islandicus]
MGTFTLHQGQSNLIKSFFRNYYLNAELGLPNDMELREFALQPFGSDTYIRHLSFSSSEELRDYLVNRNLPLHLFYSSARYQLPSARDMEEKAWMGSDLLFDIDADHICKLRSIRFCPVCGNAITSEKCERDNVETLEYVEMTSECIKRGLEEARNLVEILEDDFGLKPKVYFSGNRGFHVQVDCYGDCALLDSDERKEIAEYVMGVGVPSYPGGSENAPGWVGRKNRGINGVTIDEQVTIDVKRLIRIPNSLHGKSGFIVKEVTNLDDFEFNETLSPFTGYTIFLPYISIETEVLSRNIKLNRGVPIKIESSIGIYLHLKNLGEVKAYVR